MRRILKGTSWARTVEQVEALVQEVERGEAGTLAAMRILSGDRNPAGGRGQEHSLVEASLEMGSNGRPEVGGGAVPVVIIGAGPTGLSAAFHLGKGSLLLEREDRVGGYCRSIQDAGFTFDQAGHIMFSKEPYVHELYDLLLGDNIHWQEREAWVYTDGVHTRYPFQGALYGLPPEVIRECLMGAFEARNGTSGEPPTPPRNFEEFIHKVWGAGIARHFALPYNRKLWTVPLDEMETSWLGGRVPMPDMGEMIRGALEPTPPPMGPNARFGYPLRGGFQALMDGFLPHLEGEIRTGTEVVALDPDRRLLELGSGERVEYEQLVSTMRLPTLVQMMGDAAPPGVRRAAECLRSVAVRCVNLGVGRPDVSHRHWTYYAGNTVFHRIFFQGNASPHCNPPGGFGLTCEISYSDTKPLPVRGEALIRLCIEDCVRVGVLKEDDAILAAHEVDMPCAYILYDHDRAASVKVIREWLEGKGILLAGRYSEWEYYNSDHAFMAGRRAAEAVRSSSMRELHAELRKGTAPRETTATGRVKERRRVASGD
jgi:UDP-galactopyranose mutase